MQRVPVVSVRRRILPLRTGRRTIHLGHIHGATKRALDQVVGQGQMCANRRARPKIRDTFLPKVHPAARELFVTAQLS